MSNTSKVIELLKELELKTAFTVYIPSLKRNIAFKQLTTEQLKRILKTAIVAPIYNTKFILTINSIIKENCLDNSINTDNLTIYDKLFIVYKTKIVSISSDYTFNFTEEEINTYLLEEPNKTISLTNLFDEFANKNIIFEPKIIEQDNIIVTCNIPTLLTEDKLENEIHEEPILNENYEKEIDKIIGEAFISEITKYITSIKINDSNTDLLSLTFKERIDIIESVPVKIIGEVLKYIESYKKTIEPLQVYTFVTDKNVIFNKDIALDPTFFNI